jgi:hypothetical protein
MTRTTTMSRSRSGGAFRAPRITAAHPSTRATTTATTTATTATMTMMTTTTAGARRGGARRRLATTAAAAPTTRGSCSLAARAARSGCKRRSASRSVRPRLSVQRATTRAPQRRLRSLEGERGGEGGDERREEGATRRDGGA